MYTYLVLPTSYLHHTYIIPTSYLHYTYTTTLYLHQRPHGTSRLPHRRNGRVMWAQGLLGLTRTYVPIWSQGHELVSPVNGSGQVLCHVSSGY